MALIPTERFYKSNWAEYHRNHCFMIKEDSKFNNILLENSIVAGLIPKCMELIFSPNECAELMHLRRLCRKYSMASHQFTFTAVREKYGNSMRNQ